jgi:hypothetical protein
MMNLQAFDLSNLLPYLIVAVIGAAAGATEIVARYRDAPSRALKTRPALLYVVVNAIAAMAALKLIHSLNWTFGFPDAAQATAGQGDRLGLVQVLVAGFGAMIVLRSAVFTIRGGGLEQQIGPANVLQTILDACDRAVDRERAALNAAAVAKLMQKLQFERAVLELPLVALNVMQNLPNKDQEEMADRIADLSTDENLSSISPEAKCLSLGLILLKYVGPDVLKASIGTVRAHIEQDDRLVPAIEAIEPASIPYTSVTNGATVALTLHGQHFSPESKVMLGAQELPTTFVYASELKATVAGSDLAGLAEHPISVFTPSGAGDFSTARIFTLDGANPIPELRDIDPDRVSLDTVTKSTDGVAITVSGRKFVDGSTVKLDGKDQATNFVDENQLTALLASADLAALGEHRITVVSPEPLGGESAPQTLAVVTTGEFVAQQPTEPTVDAPEAADPSTPILNELVPPSVDQAQLDPDDVTLLIVKGHQFTSDSQVLLNGAKQPTSFESATQLHAKLATATLASPGVYVMTVYNPKSGKESKSRPFFVKEAAATGATGANGKTGPAGPDVHAATGPTNGVATGPTGPTGGKG